MKKFLLILIIAVIACVEVEEKVQKENELEVIHHDFLDSIDFEDPNIVELEWSSVTNAKLTELIKNEVIQGKDIFERVKDVIEKGKDILKDIITGINFGLENIQSYGCWDIIVGFVKKGQKDIASAVCKKFTTDYSCSVIVHIINELISK